MKDLLTYSVVLLVILFMSCEAPQEEEQIDMEAVRAEITELENNYVKAMNDRDPEALVAYYAEDAHSMPAGSPTLKGKEAILEYSKKIKNDTSGHVESSEVLDVWAAGDIAVETGKYMVKNAEGEVIYQGKYMSLFEKRDGKYVCIRDIWNSDSDPE